MACISICRLQTQSTAHVQSNDFNMKRFAYRILQCNGGEERDMKHRNAIIEYTS